MKEQYFRLWIKRHIKAAEQRILQKIAKEKELERQRLVRERAGPADDD